MSDAPGPFDALTVEGARQRSAPINAAWLDGPQRDLIARFDGIADAATAVETARSLLEDTRWTEPLLAPLIAAARKDPWFEPPFRASRDPLRTGAVLADCPAATIAATVLSAERLTTMPTPASLVVPGRISLTRYVRGGGGHMRRWRTIAAPSDFDAALAPACTEVAPLSLTDGLVVTHDGRTHGHLITAAASDIVTLTVTIKRGAAPLMREYRVADGGFIRAASADEAASRIEMLLTFLRVSGRADAGETFDWASFHPAFHLRWSAMREWLMLDARSARPRLAEMAQSDPNVQVRSAASATLSILDQRLAEPCPA